jgi:transporter family-2 protein
MMLSQWLTLLVFFVGGLSAVQVGCNGLLGRALLNPLAAATVNFSVGALCLASVLGVSVLAGWFPTVPWVAAWYSLPWYAWLGGVLGSCFVLSAVIAGPVIGAGTFTTALVTAQLLVSVMLDHFGWLGFPQQTVSGGRLLGVGLLLAGMWLIKR